MLETDYLVVGAGAVGMAFAGTLLTETDADIVVVDRHQKPGGHWNVAYPFVTLHQPSAFYGVSSRELSSGRIDQSGLNKGLNELATGAEVSAYFDAVMRHQFLPSGRIRYFPMCEHQGGKAFTSITSGKKYEVHVRNKTVDATFLKTSVPSTHAPSFSIDEGVQFIPLNDLPLISKPPSGYVIVGGGKTSIDACLWLLENNVDPDDICWIVPRDAWLIDRKNTQPSKDFFFDRIGAQLAQTEAIARADSIADLFDRLESSGVLLRLDLNVRPKMFHAATISQLELEELRRIRNIVRMGRVQRLERTAIVLENGTVETRPGQLFVDCSARAIPSHEPVPVFQDDLITPQTVRPFQPVFSAAFIAHIEASSGDLDERGKNEICGVVPLPNHDTDWITMQAAMMANQYRWSQDPHIGAWLCGNRLDGFSRLVHNVASDDAERQSILSRIRDNVRPAAQKLRRLVSEIPQYSPEVING